MNERFFNSNPRFPHLCYWRGCAICAWLIGDRPKYRSERPRINWKFPASPRRKCDTVEPPQRSVEGSAAVFDKGGIGSHV
jgi:hypothetical protein